MSTETDELTELLREAIALMPSDTLTRTAWKISAKKVADAREMVANGLMAAKPSDDDAADYAGFMERPDRFEQQ